MKFAIISSSWLVVDTRTVATGPGLLAEAPALVEAAGETPGTGLIFMGAGLMEAVAGAVAESLTVPPFVVVKGLGARLLSGVRAG